MATPHLIVPNVSSVSAAAAAAHLRMSPRNFRQLVNRGVISRAWGRGYDLNVVRAEYLDHLAARAAAKLPPEDGLDPEQERARRDRELADRVALQNERTRQEQAPVAQLRAALEAGLAHVRERLGTLPERLAPSCVGHRDPATVQALLTQAIHAELTALSQSPSPTEQKEN